GLKSLFPSLWALREIVLEAPGVPTGVSRASPGVCTSGCRCLGTAIPVRLLVLILILVLLLRLRGLILLPALRLVGVRLLRGAGLRAVRLASLLGLLPLLLRGVLGCGLRRLWRRRFGLFAGLRRPVAPISGVEHAGAAVVRIRGCCGQQPQDHEWDEQQGGRDPGSANVGQPAWEA